MRIIYCDSVLDRKQIEPDYAEEREAALAAGFGTSLMSYEALEEGEVADALRYVRPAKEKEWGVYRGWMLTVDQYASLYEGLKKKQIYLINDPAAYRHCHYLPESYAHIQAVTPVSRWTTDLAEQAILATAQSFGTTPVIVKDFVKSEKHHWEEACFIPDASNAEKVLAVVNRFLDLRGASFNEGLVFRQFEELEFLTTHTKSGMPLTKEYRLFFFNGKLIQLLHYWEEGEYGTEQPDLIPFVEVAQKIESAFFTMDIAQKQDGDWIIMELGDGQVAGLPSGTDKAAFYQKLSVRLGTP